MRGHVHPQVAKLYLEFMLLAPAFASSTTARRVVELGGATSASARVLSTAAPSPGLAPFPTSAAAYCAMVQTGFTAPPLVTPGTPEFTRRLARGRWLLRQLQNTLAVKKYRAMHKRYGWASQKDFDELTELFGEATAQRMMIGLGNKDVFGFDEAAGDEAGSETK
ncbi:hypothetical protein TraAM80_05268 [Trypanosoma rangeli]|uniref:Uncharacterized protein n=1 Tax=Trypanosoma rangeli TaxID=5698 RepID=A0A3R7ME96_TRYRA|nr:uncharacterized protein TraAM80_05268 [Trypanosoma rangeli]RNF04209.1 hypothetical protein TraAM80_05268 [Trypanosoma rangeli]|eukprot:RNF04209.1 hypothetical protein TraAM80_05268 [Trypanosoma rangeli]